jgi:hypothetical protein
MEDKEEGYSEIKVTVPIKIQLNRNIKRSGSSQ